MSLLRLQTCQCTRRSRQLLISSWALLYWRTRKRRIVACVLGMLFSFCIDIHSRPRLTQREQAGFSISQMTRRSLHWSQYGFRGARFLGGMML
ncbi:hypothetical protein BCR37DRAFT_61658 [Protomyces lactucae-debilis]|uniref:Uncharacterized protein n=1 Tax=Protomyces lactucae-debilis TaxID=2754530 RepID=A0A1Y2FAR8_PROLT|nr:uncharacterized protein BCR37DRAFT_61658 [Protomyces lactucae-debilis]ORY80981.1 hypothetical protein BCR37DRAFT_61658 [Protomyces lactucae-debilis]